MLTLLCADLDNSYISVRESLGAVALDLEALLPSPHWVHRLDDNGNTFQVARYATKEAADAVARRFEERGHKQTYWSEPA